MSKTTMGSIVWRDLTVKDAAQIRDFYATVVGWKPEPVAMGDYADYNMVAANGESAAGVCYARGENANLPPQWLIYIAVASVSASAQRCIELGGKVIDGPRPMGDKPFCVIQDPAGAYVALMEL